MTIEKELELLGCTREDALTVTRYDQAILEHPEKTTEGFLKADSFLTRDGIFEYQTRDGLIRELRTSEQVFDSASLKSLEMKPLTDGHPTENGRNIELTTDNVSQFSKGHVGENLEKVDGKVRAKILITDKALIDAVLGGRNQLSCGYVCDIKFAPGVFDGKKYDTVQSNIRYNHVSVVSAGRAGASVAMRIDSAEGAVSIQEKPKPEREPMEEKLLVLKLDAVTVGEIRIPEQKITVPEALASQVETVLDGVRTCADALEKSIAGQSTLQAKVDEAEKQKTELQAKYDELEKGSPERLAQAVKERVSLETAAKFFKIDSDGKTDQEVKKAVILSQNKDLKLDEKDPAYINARFDMLAEEAGKGGEAAGQLAFLANTQIPRTDNFGSFGGKPGDDDDDDDKKSKEDRKSFAKKGRNAHLNPPGKIGKAS
jgi:hypothetical protein